jgi:pimeloyl-ACP methyl ester carboxylesterase
MPERVLSVAVAGGELAGQRGGEGAPALLLHGGPAVPDYLGGLAAELDGLFESIRYTQRGTPPSTGGEPYTIEAHVGDAVAVLDACGLEQAWAIGHSWGGHLALHLLLAHPERLLGVICIAPLGASASVFAPMGDAMRRGLSETERARVDEIEARRREGLGGEAELAERFDLLWPQYFADPASAPPNPVDRVGAECSIQTNASIMEHFQRGTLANGLPSAAPKPVLFVHGQLDPLPVAASVDTAVLIPGARVEILPGRGHFPWMEAPDVTRAAIERLMLP